MSNQRVKELSEQLLFETENIDNTNQNEINDKNTENEDVETTALNKEENENELKEENSMNKNEETTVKLSKSINANEDDAYKKLIKNIAK